MRRAKPARPPTAAQGTAGGSPGDVLPPPSTASRTAAERRWWDETATELACWWPAFEHVLTPVTQAMVAEAGLDGASRALDVATGFGEPALTMAELVGPGGRVVATDLSPGMLAVAAERARARGLTNVDFVEMDAGNPSSAGAPFDVITCRLGLMFLPRLDAALDRLTSLLRPGGRLVAAVWGPAAANPSLTLAIGSLKAALGEGPPEPGEPGLFDLGGRDVLVDGFLRTGLRDVRQRRVELDFSWPSVAAFVEYNRRGPLRRLVPAEEPERQAAAWRALSTAAAPLARDGALRLPGEIVVVSGRRYVARGRQWAAT